MPSKRDQRRTGKRTIAPRGAAGRAGASAAPKPPRRRAVHFPIVGIGASAGGLDAFKQLLQALPADTGMAFVLIQHLDPAHTSLLREALARSTKMVVLQAEDRALVQPDHVYVIPPKADITIRDGRLALVDRPQDGRGTPHLPVDFFLRALAAERGNQAIGVVLSGTASDGTEGLRAIKAADGITLAQEPRSAKFPGMPRSAIEAGVVDSALSLPELAAELVRLSRHPYVAARPLSPADGAEVPFKKILTVVRNHTGVDFGEYKLPTVERRLARRMALRRVNGLEAYLALVQVEPEEVQALYEDILIHVTSFFRDPESFDLLKTQVFPALLQQKPGDVPLRMWVAGCSSGEEVYSLAIALLESMDDSSRQIQIFGSDVSPRSIEKARAGVYPEGALRDLADERRRRYFTRTEGGYRIVKSVRDMCVFVEHNLARDPPFSKLDLVTCRNVLIYFDTTLQQRVLSRFHYSLNQPGFLLLGRTESISGFGELFSPVDRQSKLFARSALPTTLRFARPSATPSGGHEPIERHLAEPRRAVDLAQRVDRLLLTRYAPPGALVDEHMEIVQYRGHTGAYLQPAPGPPQHNIIKMARGGLLATLRATLARAKEQLSPVRAEAVAVEQDGITRTCDVVVIPVTGGPGPKAPLFLVLFEEHEAASAPRSGPARSKATVRKDDSRTSKLEAELAATKDYLHSLVEEHGRASDDLGSANEELISGNEELQSMNEELETAKEELQSTNEELTTVNDELHSRNLELARVNSDLVNVLGTVEIPIVILDMERRIRRYTPYARQILSVMPSDLGRPIDDLKLKIEVPDLSAQIVNVIETMQVKESEVRDLDGHWYRMQIRPYKTTENAIDGAIVSLVDIDALKHHVGEAQLARREAERANLAKDQFLATLSHELRSPLAAMLMHAQLLTRGGMDDVKLRRAGEAIERGTKMQLQLIEDLLEISRIVAGKLTLNLGSVKLDAAVREALEGARAAAERKAIVIETALDGSLGRVAGDPTRLLQIVSNLLTNAIKFTPQGGKVSVSLERAGELARLRVRDTGVGMEPAFVAQAFNRFSQEDGSSTRAFGGLGLGLAIVRHLVELHGGTVEAESPGKGQGATFTVTLPLLGKPASEPGAGEETGSPPPAVIRPGAGEQGLLRDLLVLVLDDDVEARDALAEMLQQQGASVATASSTDEAMTTVEELRPDVLVSDIAMPGEDGLSFMRRLRALGAARGGDTPALALSALAGEKNHRLALAAGFQLSLSKPVEMDALIEAVAMLAKQASSPAAGPRAARRRRPGPDGV